MKLVARDGGNPPFESTRYVIIKILDTDDHNPVYPTYQVSQTSKECSRMINYMYSVIYLYYLNDTKYSREVMNYVWRYNCIRRKCSYGPECFEVQNFLILYIFFTVHFRYTLRSI